ncbi:MAG: hypothetical protein KGJ90_04920 [Patescibacteria group bacterium]|nr:hypothetical protein [Patescibacteria group bacterium]
MAETFENGSQRSERRPLYTLIPLVAIKAIAERFAIGAAKYGKDNWKKGGPDFYEQTKNHLIHHFWCYLENRLEDEASPIDHLKAVAWNAAALLWWELEGKHD